MHVHAGHVVGHGHVGGREQRAGIERWNRGAQPRPCRKRAAGETGAIDRLREHRVGLIARLDDRIEDLAGTEPKLLDRHGLNVLTVDGDHAQRQTWNAHIEEAHRRAVDESQPHALPAPKQPRPVAGRRCPVHEIGIAVAAHIREIRRVHAHGAPHQPIPDRGCESTPASVPHQLAERSAPIVEDVTVHLEQSIDLLRIAVTPVRQQNGVLAVAAMALTRTRAVPNAGDSPPRTRAGAPAHLGVTPLSATRAAASR